MCHLHAKGTNPIYSTTVAVMRLASLASAITDRKFKEIADEHSLTTSYGPLICTKLPYGEQVLMRKMGLVSSKEYGVDGLVLMLDTSLQLNIEKITFV